MAGLKTNYKDRLLDTSVNTERKFNLVDSDGNVVQSGVSLRDITQYSQAGDTFGAADINKITAKINEHNNNLTAPDGAKYYADKQDGKYGVNTDPNRGADTFIPFNSIDAQNPIFVSYVYGTTNAAGYLYATYGEEPLINTEYINKDSADSKFVAQKDFRCKLILWCHPLHKGGVGQYTYGIYKNGVKIDEWVSTGDAHEPVYSSPDCYRAIEVDLEKDDYIQIYCSYMYAGGTGATVLMYS